MVLVGEDEGATASLSPFGIRTRRGLGMEGGLGARLGGVDSQSSGIGIPKGGMCAWNPVCASETSALMKEVVT
jgi:hypothetical protein